MVTLLVYCLAYFIRRFSVLLSRALPNCLEEFSTWHRFCLFLSPREKHLLSYRFPRFEEIDLSVKFDSRNLATSLIEGNATRIFITPTKKVPARIRTFEFEYMYSKFAKLLKLYRHFVPDLKTYRHCHHYKGKSKYLL